MKKRKGPGQERKHHYSATRVARVKLWRRKRRPDQIKRQEQEPQDQAQERDVS